MRQNILELFHGSPQIVERPLLRQGKLANDYGQGFYCTEHLELAREWACAAPGRNGFVNSYELDLEGLAVLDLTSKRYNVLNWLALLVNNRVFDVSLPVARQGIAFLRENFLPDTGPYDIVVGYRADDSYFSFARTFVNNAISVEQLARSMYLGSLGEQVVLRSEKAFDGLIFIGAQTVDAATYYPKRAERDAAARGEYQRIAREQGIAGLYMRDIILEGVRPDDERLQ